MKSPRRQCSLPRMIPASSQASNYSSTAAEVRFEPPRPKRSGGSEISAQVSRRGDAEETGKMPMAKRTALVTGASGLAGGYMLAHLLEQGGWDIVAVSRRKPQM